MPSPFQQLEIRNKQSGPSGSQARKAARLSSGASVGAAIVEAENDLETEVCFSASEEAL